jgi:hypothetical protein
MFEINPAFPDATDEEVWMQFRFWRDRELAMTDKLMAPDYPLGNKEEWVEYRQALRDIPENFSNPREIQLPLQPGTTARTPMYQ